MFIPLKPYLIKALEYLWKTGCGEVLPCISLSLETVQVTARQARLKFVFLVECSEAWSNYSGIKPLGGRGMKECKPNSCRGHHIMSKYLVLGTTLRGGGGGGGGNFCATVQQIS